MLRQLWTMASEALTEVNAVAVGRHVAPWGDGLLDQSLTSLWQRTDWSDVSDDELVFLLPSLASWRSGRTRERGSRDGGPLSYLTRALRLHAHALGSRLSESAGGGRHVLETLAARGIVTALAADELARPLSMKPDAVVPRLEAAKGRASAGQDGRGYSGLPDWLLLELMSLAYLDRLVCDAKGGSARGTPLVDWSLSMHDLVAASIASRLNAAYLHPEYTHAHELFAAAAVLGHLVLGRAVYLPPSLAPSFVDLLSSEGPHEEDEACALVFRMYASCAGGAARLRSAAERVLDAGGARLVAPRRSIPPADTGRGDWNARLSQRIAQRWQLSS